MRISRAWRLPFRPCGRRPCAGLSCRPASLPEPECDFSPPCFDACGELAILAARSLDMPLSFSASYCFSFLTCADLPGIAGPSFSWNGDGRARGYPRPPNAKRGDVSALRLSGRWHFG